jgi:hypothetical protein
MSRGLHSRAMTRALTSVAAAVVLAAACRQLPAEAGQGQQRAGLSKGVAPEDGPGDEGQQAHAADAIASAAAPHVIVTDALVLEYLRYRRLVVERGRTAVEIYRKASSGRRGADPTAGAVRSARAAEEFAVRMRAIEESARTEVGLSRDQVAAVGQVAAEVLSARQLWRMSGGDDALRKARGQLAAVPAAKRRAAEEALARNEQGFSEMRDARSARKRFGDAAVDAILAREDALWKVQQDGARVMAEVY